MAQIIPGAQSKILTLGALQWPYGSNIKTLVAKTDAANRYSCFREIGSSTDYVVPANKSFKCVGAVAAGALAAGTVATIALGYANTAATFGGGGAPTSPIYAVGGDATYRGNLYAPPAGASYSFIGFNIPTGKYPFMDDGSATPDGYVMLFGYEE